MNYLAQKLIQTNKMHHYGQGFYFGYPPYGYYPPYVPYPDPYLNHPSSGYQPYNSLLHSNQIETPKLSPPHSEKKVVEKIEEPQELQKQNFLDSEKPKNVFQPIEEIKQDRKKKKVEKYMKDQNRNIIPNVVSQVFSFLEKKYKSGPALEELLKKFGVKQVERDHFVKQFYRYHKYLRTKMNKHLNEKTLKLMFGIGDERCQFFSLQIQKKIAKVNVIMSCYFLGSGEHLIQVLSAKKINREKIPTYLSARRRIRQKITEFYGEDVGERIIFL